ncbi:MAG TPA: response regulator [Candidatus Acidoferrales bacterium]|nr:response regulator [Candidatus Acidoferrales bacterium]
MSDPAKGAVEVFLVEASEHLQTLREYSGILQEPSPNREDLERLYIAAHTLSGTSATYGFPLFSEIAGKLAHIFQYTRNAPLNPETIGPLTEFLSDAISVLEFDLLEISDCAAEVAADIQAFKQRYSFAFPAAPAPAPTPTVTAREEYSADDNSSSQFDAVPLEQENNVAAASFYDQLPSDSDVPDEVLQFFVPEAEEHLQVVTDCLLTLESNSNPEDINRLFRSMHTVKGSAAQVGLHRISAIAHRVEDLIGQVRDGALTPDAELIDICLQSVDVLKKFLHHDWADEETARSAVDSLLGRIAERVSEHEQETIAAVNVEQAEAGADAGASPIHASAEHIEPRQQRAIEKVAHPESTQPQLHSVRISLDRLDKMMNAVGELVINRTRMIGRLAELEKLVEILNFSKGRLSEKISSFQEKYEFTSLGSSRAVIPVVSRGDAKVPGNGLRKERFPKQDSFSDFTELEMDRYDDFNILSRSLTEISSDVNEVLAQLGGFMGRVESDIDEFTKLAHHLQDQITQARMVPIGNLYRRLARTVRDAAKVTGKEVELVLEGASTELDNNIVQQISDPLIHVVRNAVAHGIEEPGERAQSGKDPKGRIGIRAYHRGNHIFIEVEDNGQGIDPEQIRARAVEGGFISAEQSRQLNERELRDLLFIPGFSTAREQTELAGRGVGLDVVKANLNALNGEVEIRSQIGEGSCFTLKVPLTLIISQALFIRCGSTIIALPLAFVEEIRRLRPDQIEDVGGKLLTRVRDEIIDVVRLDNRLGLPPLETINGYFRMVIVNIAGRHVGVIVEEVLRKDEVVIKSLGEYLRNLKLFPGAIIASDGSLILLLDLHRLAAQELAEHATMAPVASAARIFAPGAMAVAAGSIPAEAIDEVQEERVVVVADDSISVRKFVGRMLEKAGYRVRLASDGLEAAELVALSGAHLIITDLEMPRMNGYELMSHLRQNPDTRRIPVLVVTSRAGAKHRDRALKEGASGFLTKPVQEDQLLGAISQILGLEKTGSRNRPVPVS